MGIEFESHLREQDFISEIYENGFEVFITRDPQLEGCAATLSITAGHKHDPPDLPGICYFVSRAIRCGSSKFPEYGEFDRFFKENYDSCISTSRPDVTIFKMRLSKEYLSESFERLADAVTSPKLCEHSLEYLTQENNVLLLQGLKDDSYRSTRALFHYVNHSRMRYFDVDNVLNYPDLLERAREFVDVYYKPANMKLAIIGGCDVSFSEMNDMIRRIFGRLENKTGHSYADFDPLKNKEQLDHALDRAYSGKQLNLRTLSDVKLLNVCFRVPDTRVNLDIQPFDYYLHLIELSSYGSFCYKLKVDGLIESLECEIIHFVDDHEYIEIKIKQTLKGSTQTERILNQLFGYLSIITSTMPDMRYWENMRCASIGRCALERDNWAYKTDNYCQLLHFPIPRNKILNFECVTNFDAKIIEQYGSYITYSNSLITCSSNKFTNAKLQDAEFFLQYDVHIPEIHSCTEGLRMPDVDAFIPQAIRTSLPQSSELSILSSDIRTQIAHIAVKDELRVVFYLRITQDQFTAFMSQRCALYASMIDFKMNLLINMSPFVRFSATSVRDAIEIKIVCLPDNLASILKQMVTFLTEPTGEDFVASFTEIRDKHISDMYLKLNGEPDVQLAARSEYLLNPQTYNLEDQARQLPLVEFQHLPKSISGNLTMLFAGNISKCDVWPFVQVLFPLLPKSSAESPPLGPVMKRRKHVSPTHQRPPGFPGKNDFYMPLKIPKSSSGKSAVYLAYYFGTYEHNAWASLLTLVTSAELLFRDEFRNQSKLAYDVNCEARNAKNHMWFIFQVVGHCSIEQIAEKVNYCMDELMEKNFESSLKDDILEQLAYVTLHDRFTSKRTLFEISDMNWEYFIADPLNCDPNFETQIIRGLRELNLRDYIERYKYRVYNETGRFVRMIGMEREN